ncbi:MAG: hypothetical protein IJS52_01665 [Bacilli bacterium]|nr:hypothetical protein [Bacilli bacterium]
MNIHSIKRAATALVIAFLIIGVLSAALLAPIPYFRDVHSDSYLGLVEMIVYLICSLAVYALLFVVLRESLRKSTDTLFMNNFAKAASFGGKVLLCGSIAFEAFFLVALILRMVQGHIFEQTPSYEAIVTSLGFELACVLIGLVGLAISVALSVFAKALAEGKTYKEDSEAIV